MMDCDRYTEAIGDYVDGTLDERRRAEVDRHLADCPACRALVADLRQIHGAARQFEPLQPPARVWQEISRRIAAESGAIRAAGPAQAVPARRAGLSAWLSPAWQAGLAAAAVLALITVTASIVWLIERPGGRQAPVTASTGAAPASQASAAPATPESVAGELKQAEAHYEKAIAGLQQIAKAGEGSLDPKVAASLQKNLA
ncbi:MAG: zf-HC2 domain-containing protein, partial [Acidobacteriota bacterium]|nr:zf-HC2 domain-containing protein [Acidobacteriota bacterium]